MQCRRRALGADIARSARSRTPVGYALALAALAVSSAPNAGADEPDAGGTFDFGLAEMLAGRYATGCPALEASFRADPRPGTLFTLADCDRKWGKTASALARFGEYVALYERMPADQRAKQRERAAIATNERANLERTVPLLSVRLPPDAPAGTRVWRDDVELAGPALAAATPVDPGEHRVRAQLAGGAPREQRIVVAPGEQRTVVVDLSPEAAEPAPAPSPPPAPLPAHVPEPSPAPAKPASHAGWTYAGAGLTVASVAVAAVTGGVALNQRSVASPVCDAQGICTTTQGVNAGNEARSLANVETGALVVAGLALIATAILWWTEPRARPVHASIAPLAGAGGVGAAW